MEQNELWNQTYTWLNACGSRPDRQLCKQEMTAHPDYPALASLTDFLEQGGFRYKAVRLPTYSNLMTLNYPLLAQTVQADKPSMEILSAPDEWNHKDQIKAIWTGIVIFPENNSKWENSANKAAKKRTLARKIVTVGAFVLILTVALTTMRRLNNIQLLFYFLSILGILASILALKISKGESSQLLSIFCKQSIASDCNRIMKSRIGKGVFGYSLADIALLYFSTQYLTITTAVVTGSGYGIIHFLAFFGFLPAFVSIYLQLVSFKKICKVCLLIILLLLIQNIVSFSELNTIEFKLELTGISFLLTVLAALLLVFWPVKKLMNDSMLNAARGAELKKWVMDIGIFMQLRDRERVVNTDYWDHEIILGRHSAPLKLTVVTNPYCYPCAQSHKLLEEILRIHDQKIQAHIRFMCNHKEARIAAKSIISETMNHVDKLVVATIVRDWFELRDIKKWKARWYNTDEMKGEVILTNHDLWIQDSGINKTPTLFLNGKKVPDVYRLSDVAQLIPQLMTLTDHL